MNLARFSIRRGWEKSGSMIDFLDATIHWFLHSGFQKAIRIRWSTKSNYESKTHEQLQIATTRSLGGAMREHAEVHKRDDYTKISIVLINKGSLEGAFPT